MIEALYEVTHLAPLAIFVAAVLDVFFISGFLLYGFATLGAIGMMYMNDMVSIPEIIVAALIGTLIGNQANYWIGRFFSTKSFIQKRVQTERAQKAVGFLRTRGLFLYMVIGCYVTFFRPIHGLILGVFKVDFKRFLIYDIIISTSWILFWLFLILSGEQFLRQHFG